ncbi:MAG: RnfABCDGE type electron transport complex subunit D [Acidobacteriota bacterium]
MPALPTAPLSRKDPRLFQIASLAVLLAYGMTALLFDISPLRVLLLVSTALAAQLTCSRAFRLPVFDPWSALISALSLCLLLRTGSPAIAIAAAVIAISSKFLLRWNGKHLFNPTNIALAAILAATSRGWVSPGQWGNAAFFAFFIACAGRFVVQRATRGDVTLAFLGTYLLLVFGRSAALHEPLTIALHRLESGALLLFAFFMISDPKTTPDSRTARILFGSLVAVGAAYVQFRLFRPNGAIWSLALVSLLVPLLDLLWPAPGSSRVVRFRLKGDFHAPLLRLRPHALSLRSGSLPARSRLLRLLRGQGGSEAL